MYKHKIRIFHALLANTGMMQNKADILSGYGVESTKDLSGEQLDELIDRLKQISEGKTQASPKIRKKRSVVLSLLTDLGVYENSGSWKRVNAYLLEPRIAGKLLYEMNEDELAALAVKLRMIKKKESQKAEEESFLAVNN